MTAENTKVTRSGALRLSPDHESGTFHYRARGQAQKALPYLLSHQGPSLNLWRCLICFSIHVAIWWGDVAKIQLELAQGTKPNKTSNVYKPKWHRSQWCWQKYTRTAGDRVST